MKILRTLFVAPCLLAACAALPGGPLVETGAEFREIAVLEDARSTGGGRLQGFLEHPDPDLREHAATALGRMPWPEHGAEVTHALLMALEDENVGVRAAAAFALGMRRDPVAGERLLVLALDEGERDEFGRVRARAIEAASKLERSDLRLRTLDGLRDPDKGVRIEAAQGAHRWSREEETAEAVDRRLIERLESETDVDVVWMTVFSLQRRAAPSARAAFLHYAVSDVDLVRLYAVRGLKSLAPDPEVLPALERATNDADWRIACEALVGLGAYELGTSPGVLIAATEHANAHVRRTAWETLSARMGRGGEMSSSKAWAPLFAAEEPHADESASVRAAFVAANTRYQSLTGSARLSTKAVMQNLQNDRWTPEDWIAFARSLADERFDPSAPKVLDLLIRNPDPRIAGPAIEALGRHPSEQVRKRLHGLLTAEDNGMRLSAVLALREMPDASDLTPLTRAFRTSRGDIGPEVRFNVLRNAGTLGGEAARVLLMQGLGDADAWVRHVAREELDQRWPEVHAAEAAALAVPEPRPDPVPLAGADYPVYDHNPRVEIDTTRGAMVFELFPGETPIHVHNFLTMAKRGHYDGTLFHRVVPDFVIQGGDYRGDGNGGTTYRGEGSLRHEITPRKYVRGSLGMPRNENPDSGGSQIFVTHRPTPHLDGRYTIFGELRRGAGVLDAIEVGDHIVGVRRLD
jgi:cyclophilin family peptidyl-prolyl cis-trans isomerase/HEAT repeat protein